MAPFDPGDVEVSEIGDQIQEIGTLFFESAWLRDAVQFSLKATSWTSSLSATADGPPQQRDPRFRKLVEGILFSRRFVLTYHLVVLGFITIVALGHWSKKAIRWQRSRGMSLQSHKTSLLAYDYPDCQRSRALLTSGLEGASSSSSSTLEGTEIPPQKNKDVDEETALLRRLHPLKARSLTSNLWSNFKAFLMYQPPPLPIFLQTHKILPSIGIMIIITAFIGLNGFYTFYRINFNMMELFVLADRCALVFVINLPLLYLVSAKTQPLQFLTGKSYESLNIFHRRLGEILCLEALLHTSGMVVFWYALLRPTGFTLLRFIFNKTILTGIGAFVAYEFLYLTARPWFRQFWYEMFLGLHVFLQAAALVLLFFHHSASRIYVGVALGIFIIDRSVYRILLKTTSVISDAQIMDDGETVRLSSNFDLQRKGTLNRLIGTTTGGWQAADHIFLTIPSLGRKHILQAHPFTIASPAPTSDTDNARLKLLIRAQDGFSLDLLQTVAAGQDSLKLRIDGPYGSGHARTLLADADLSIVVAGGSGIAVAWPLIHYLVDRRRSTDTKVASESELRRQHIVLIWIVHRGLHISWIGRPALQEIDDKGVDVIIPQATEEVGRPDLEEIIDGIVLKAGNRKRIGVVGSGPDSMGRSVRNTCARLVRNGRDVDVAIEKFGW